MTEQDKINQAITATKRVMRALQRQCLPDLVTAWQELRGLVSLNVSAPVELSSAEVCPYTWEILTENVWMALEAAGQHDHNAQWHKTDMRLRAYVRSILSTADVFEHTAQHAIYRAFVEGK